MPDWAVKWQHKVKGGRTGVMGLTGQRDHPDDNHHIMNAEHGHNHHLNHDHDPHDPEVWLDFIHFILMQRVPLPASFACRY